MCHIILLLPVITLPVFWFLPFPVATTTYVLVVIFSFWVYLRLMQTMHQPVVTGREALHHASGEVLRLEGHQVLVRISGEIWKAQTSDYVKPGDSVDVTDVQGLRLVIKRRA